VVLLGHAWLRVAAAWAVFLTEAALPVLLLVPRTRLFGIAAAVLLHVGFEIVARPDVMGLVVGALLLSFVPVNVKGRS
jgi:hypothetical protein